MKLGIVLVIVAFSLGMIVGIMVTNRRWKRMWTKAIRKSSGTCSIDLCEPRTSQRRD